MYQDKYGKIASEFNQKYNIVVNAQALEFEENLLNYKYNSLLPQFQERIQNNIRAAILTAQRGYISLNVLRNYIKELYLKDFNNLLLLYKESLKAQQQNQFYFSGIGSGIKVEKVTWPFIEGFGFCIWINVEQINYDQFNETNLGVQKIISIHGQGQQGGGGIECYIMRGSIYYRIIPTIYQEPQMGNGAVYIGQLKNGMNFIGISHETQKKFSSSHLTLYFNNEQPKTMTLEYPKLNSNIALTRFIICENLFGHVNCIILMNQSSTKIKTIQQVYGQLQMDYKQLKTLPACLDKYFDRIMSIYIPEFSDGNHIIDVMGNCHAIMQYKTGTLIADKNKFLSYGGFKLYYMMLHLSGTQYKTINQAQQQLIIMLDILNQIFKNNPQLQADAFNNQFFPTISSIIMSFEKQFITTKFVELLNETKQIINDIRLQDQFFQYILWNSKLHQLCENEQVFSKFLQLSCLQYLQNPQHYQNFITSKDLLDILIFSYSDNQCCDIHFPDIEQTYQLQFFEKILYLFNQHSDISEYLIQFDSYLISKISPCLLLQIFTILKSLLVDNEDQGIKTQQILQTWNQNNIIKQLLFLFKITPYYDIRAMIIYFLNLIFQQQFTNYKIQTHEAIQYIINAIEPLQEISKEQQNNNIDELKNLGTQFLNNDYESVPQAPSMINRRKPVQQFFDQRPPRAQSIPSPEIDKPKPPSFSVDQKGKKKFHIKIDTDAINALYNFGGEQGKKNGFDHEAFEQEMKEINRLARSCHMYMQGYREPEEQQQPIVIRQPLMSTKHSQAPKILQELTQIKEVSSSSMSIQQKQKKYQSFSLIYNQLLGWMIDKIGINDSLMIEEGDQIKNPGIINAIMKIFTYSTEDNLKAQILQDLLCLCKSHQSNSILMLGQSKFQADLLKALSLQEDQNLIFEIGSRLHVTLLINVLKSEFIGADYIYELLKSGLLVEQQMIIILESLNEQCKNYQCDSQLWKNTILVGLYLIESKEQYPQLIQKYSKIFDIIYKHFNIQGNNEEQIQQIKQYYNEAIQQQAQQIWQFLNNKIQNYLVYEIMLELSDQNNINQLLITYSLVLELSKQQLYYGLNQIIGKMILKDNQNLKQTLNIIFQIINISKNNQQNSSLYNWLQEQQIENIEIDELIKSDKFKYDFIDIKVNIPQPWQMDCMVSLSKITREVQQYGENKYIEIEEHKTQWLYIESEKERIGRNKYKKAINSLFQTWMDDSFLQYDKIFDQNNYNPNPNIKFKISKILTKTYARPYLKTIYQIPQQLLNKPIFQTPTIAPILLTHESDKYEQLYGQKQTNNSQAAQAAVQLLNMGKAFGNNIKNAVKTIANQKQIDVKSFTDNTFKGKKVILINGLYIINAFLSLNNINLILQIEQIRQEQTHISLCQFQLKDDKRLIKIYPIYNIVLIIKKKYLQKRNALEIFFIDGKSLFISIPDQNDLDEIAQKLLRYRKSQQAPYFQQSKTTDPIKLLDKQGYLQKWNKQQMSNFKYLLLLNNLASRSYNDLTQYPIFPWVICENRDKIEQQQDKQRIYPDGQFRAMQKTMGALGNNQRIKSYIERFEQSEQGGEIPAFHYGSHYSSPAITSQYLIRLEPFTTAAKEIQGGKFDISDRLFYSFIESYRCATEDIADVRELIPEIFCLPEMFLNLQNLNFGKTQNQMQVNHVILPKWSNNNPWLFVTGQRNALESEEIQRNIPEWIDLIFGFKQRGKEAEKALNIFFYVTYDSQLTLEKMEENKLSIETQIVNFGITPIQLFNKPHISRQINQEYQFVSNSQELKVYRPQNKKKIPNTMKSVIDIQQASNRAIIKIKWISDVRLMCIRKEGKIDYLKWTSQNDVQANQPPFQCGLEREKQFNFEKPINELYNIWDISAQLQQYPLIILNQGKLFLCGGYHLGKLIMINENNQIQDIYQIHTNTITCLQSDKKETIIISGDKSGHVILWKLDKLYKLQAKCIYFDHQSQINCIYISTNMKLFSTGCNNGIIHIYNLYNGQLLRQFKHPNKYSINTILLSSRPLYSIIFFSSIDNLIYSYSINGFYLESQIEQCKSLIDCQIMRNNLFQDIMIYGTENGDLVRRSLPYLQQLKRFQISAKSPVLSISHSKDKKFFICGCNDGEISVMAEPLK